MAQHRAPTTEVPPRSAISRERCTPIYWDCDVLASRSVTPKAPPPLRLALKKLCARALTRRGPARRGPYLNPAGHPRAEGGQKEQRELSPLPLHNRVPWHA